MNSEMDPQTRSLVLERTLTYLLTEENDDHDGGLENDPEDEGEKLSKWLKDMVDRSSEDLNPFDRRGKTTRTPALSIYNPLRECLLNRNWGEALRLIEPLIHDHRMTAVTVFKVGLEICHQLDPDRGRWLEQLFSQLMSFPGLNPYELFLEQAFFVLGQEKMPPPVQEALDVFKMFKKPHVQKVFNSDKDNQIIQVLFEANRGLVVYAQWLLTKQRLAEIEERNRDEDGWESSGSFEDGEIDHQRRMLKIDSDRALASLKVVEGHSGVLDVFITKYVELLEHRGLNSEALTVLEGYFSQNPENPNSLRYLMEFNQRHGNYEDAYDNLKKLAKMLPTEPLVLDLYDLQKEKGIGTAETLSLLFDLLDHVSWQDEPRPWRHLAEDLLDILNQ